jgi:DNA (cytosine-5)-methyltransferase 1
MNAYSASNNHTNNNTSSKPLFTYAEMFAGMGGFGVALDALGGHCIFCSELEEHLRDVYRHNFITLPNQNRKQQQQQQHSFDIPIHGDIYQVPDSAFPTAGTLDLLVGGFPCQPFSALGQQPGLKCPKSGNLFLEIVRFLKVSRPKAFLLENVPGLLAMTETFEIITTALEEVGYTVSSEVCSAKGLTATGRKRLFIVGIRDHGDNPQFEFPFVPDLQLRARDVLDYDDLPEEELQILRLSNEAFEKLLSGGRFRTHNLAWPNKSLDTLTSHYGNAVGRGESQLVPCKAPYLPRRFSIREMSRLMGFPDCYEFLPPNELQSAMGYRKQHYRMIGNAVCPPLIASLAGAVLHYCPDIATPKKSRSTTGTIDWVQRGREVAIELAFAATRRPTKLPRGCLLPTEYSKFIER